MYHDRQQIDVKTFWQPLPSLMPPGDRVKSDLVRMETATDRVDVTNELMFALRLTGAGGGTAPSSQLEARSVARRARRPRDPSHEDSLFRE